MFRLPQPDLQIEFSVLVAEIRRLFLRDALLKTVRELPIPQLDAQLSAVVPHGAMAELAARGLRAETMFPVPLLLEANPRLLGYYRLLYGFSQKTFYTKETGIATFKAMEERGVLPRGRISDLPGLCGALCATGGALLTGIGPHRITLGLLDDLTILTAGAQLRGGANVRRGARGIVRVFEAIHDVVRHAVVESDASRMVLTNAAGRRVTISFAADPDIIIREHISETTILDKIAIEVKAGEDFSNIHNRIGEAEKSHQKARGRGVVECWTVVNVDRIDIAMARRESPTTNQFFRLSAISSHDGGEYDNFRDRLLSLTGIQATSLPQTGG